MKIAVMQPYFFPYIGAYQLVSAVDKYIVYGNINFRSDGWFHRNRFLEIGKGPTFFNVHLLASSFKKTFFEIEVDPSKLWRRRLIKTIEHNYRKTSYYDSIIGLLREIVNSDYQYLADYNANTMTQISRFLDIGTIIEHPYAKTLEIEDFLEIEYSAQTVSEHILDKKTARIMEICKRENAQTYINPIGGTALYSKDSFALNGIDLYFLQTENIQYKQLSNNFEPNLSIIDVLMNCGKEQTQQYLDCYQLI